MPPNEIDKLVEETARIIDPEAWAERDNGKGPVNPPPLAVKLARSLAKANAIHALYASTHKALEAERDELKRTVERRDRQQQTTRQFWIRDAEEALAGDMRALRNRVEMAKLGPVEIIQSEETP